MEAANRSKSSRSGRVYSSTSTAKTQTELLLETLATIPTAHQYTTLKAILPKVNKKIYEIQHEETLQELIVALEE